METRLLSECSLNCIYHDCMYCKLYLCPGIEQTLERRQATIRVILGNLCLLLNTAFAIMDTSKVTNIEEYKENAIPSYQEHVNLYHDCLTKSCTATKLGKIKLQVQGEGLCCWPVLMILMLLFGLSVTPTRTCRSLHVMVEHLADSMLFFAERTSLPYGVTKLQVTEHMNSEIKAAGEGKILLDYRYCMKNVA